MCPGPFPNLGAGPGNAATSFTIFKWNYGHESIYPYSQAPAQLFLALSILEAMEGAWEKG